jgi:hypothetical protein
VFGALTDPAKYRDPSAVNKAIRALFSESGVDWHRSHGARKFITNKLHEAGYSQNKIMRYMGWDNPATLLAYLDKAQALPDDMADTLDLTSVPQLIA